MFIYIIRVINNIKMIDNKNKDDNTSSKSTDMPSIYDTTNENFTKIVNEMAKAQPQYSQSISNLQLDYIQTTKNVIQNTISAQKQLAGSSNWSVPIIVPYTEQFTKQSNEITNNTIRAVGINNQLTINALDAARENLKIYNRTVDAVTEFSTNVFRAWNSFFSVQQQQFFR
jgi:hypothetical protein